VGKPFNALLTIYQYVGKKNHIFMRLYVFWEGTILGYDVIIIGAGPAGIFSALELAEKTSLSILMLASATEN